MYSRSLQDPGSLPPHYGGTVLREGGREKPSSPCPKPPEREDCAPCREERPSAHTPPVDKEPCRGDSPLPALLSRLLPAGIESSDLLLLCLSLLLLTDGCEDEFLPLVLLFLLIVH